MVVFYTVVYELRLRARTGQRSNTRLTTAVTQGNLIYALSLFGQLSMDVIRCGSTSDKWCVAVVSIVNVTFFVLPVSDYLYPDTGCSAPSVSILAPGWLEWPLCKVSHHWVTLPWNLDWPVALPLAFSSFFMEWWHQESCLNYEIHSRNSVYRYLHDREV